MFIKTYSEMDLSRALGPECERALFQLGGKVFPLEDSRASTKLASEQKIQLFHRKCPGLAKQSRKGSCLLSRHKWGYKQNTQKGKIIENHDNVRYVGHYEGAGETEREA